MNSSSSSSSYVIELQSNPLSNAVSYFYDNNIAAYSIDNATVFPSLHSAMTFNRVIEGRVVEIGYCDSAIYAQNNNQ